MRGEVALFLSNKTKWVGKKANKKQKQNSVINQWHDIFRSALKSGGECSHNLTGICTFKKKNVYFDLYCFFFILEGEGK